ncbi:MAG: metallophosphoesterase [Tissierellia bacterium]|nr:metallophosphoesterase [Tissierellia bacterium]
MKLKIKIIYLIALLVLIVFIIIGLNNKVITTTYYIEDKRLKKGFKVILITDTHSCKYGEGQREVLDKIASEKPDLILLSGDIIDDDLPMELGFWTVKKIAEFAPTFYVTGNHEIWSQKYDYIKDRIRAFGIKVLEGNGESIEINGNEILIMGLDDLEIGGEYNRQLMDLEKVHSDKLTFLLAHRPERLMDYDRLDLDYVFSGHAHGGQWRLPVILERGLLAPNQGLFPKYTVGVNDLGSYRLIVSRGLSRESTIIPRFYNPPEVVVINFE